MHLSISLYRSTDRSIYIILYIYYIHVYSSGCICLYLCEIDRSIDLHMRIPVKRSTCSMACLWTKPLGSPGSTTRLVKSLASRGKGVGRLYIRVSTYIHIHININNKSIRSKYIHMHTHTSIHTHIYIHVHTYT